MYVCMCVYIYIYIYISVYIYIYTYNHTFRGNREMRRHDYPVSEADLGELSHCVTPPRCHLTLL